MVGRRDGSFRRDEEMIEVVEFLRRELRTFGS
jgi:hypothetical protein